MGNERPLTTPFDRAVALVVAISLEGSTLGVAAMAWERPKPRDPNIEKRRLAAVAKMRKATGADPKKVAVLHERTEKIEQKHLPSRLYGLAQTEAQLRKALAEASRPALSPQAKRAAWTKVKAEAAAVTAGAAKVEKILSTSKSPHAAAFLAKLKVAKHLAAAVAVRPGKPEQMDKAVAELSSLLAKVRAPPKKPFGHAPKSRQLTPVTPRVRQASLDDLHLMHPRYASVGAMFHVATTLSELAEGALAPPTPQDLLATPEAPITPAITALAASLQNDPVQIYKYVRNTIVPEPYFGSKKGALGALAEGTGNDYDQASLLVSLLRASNIPARYETGQVLLSPRQAMDFTNTDDPTAAVTVMDTIGMLATANLDQNNNIDSVALDQHAWVRAYVPYTNYRGSNAPGSRSIWVRLDPSVKVVDREPPAFAIGTNVTFNFANYLSGTTPMSTVSSPLTVFETQLASYLQANPSLQCDNLNQLRPTNAPVALDLHLLPSELGTQLVQSESVSDALESGNGLQLQRGCGRHELASSEPSRGLWPALRPAVRGGHDCRPAGHHPGREHLQGVPRERERRAGPEGRRGGGVGRGRRLAWHAADADGDHERPGAAPGNRGPRHRGGEHLWPGARRQPSDGHAARGGEGAGTSSGRSGGAV